MKTYKKVHVSLFIFILSISSQAGELHRAIRSSDFLKVEQLIESGIDVHVKNENGNTLLHEAITLYRDQESSTHLSQSGMESKLHILHLLLRAGIDVNGQNLMKQTPLHLAAQTDFGPSNVTNLIRWNLWGTTETLIPNMVNLLLKAGADPNIEDSKGQTALHYTAADYRLDKMKLLLKAEAHPNTQDKNGQTPLHKAAYWDQPGAVKLLLEAKADASIRNAEGKTALELTTNKDIRRMIRSALSLNFWEKIQIQIRRFFGH